MEQLKDEYIEKMFKDHVRKGLPVIKRGKAGIITNVKEGAHKYLLLGFPNQKFAAEPVKHKVGWGELGEFIFTYAQGTPREEAQLNLAKLTLYHKETGCRVVNTHLENGQICLGRVIILNSRILVIRGEKKLFPRFFAVIGSKLTEVPATVAESALRFSGLTDEQKASFIKHHQSEGWEVHNGIIVNPQTLEVPTELHFQFWKKGRYNKARLVKVDMFLLSKVLTCSDNERAVIKYITL